MLVEVIYTVNGTTCTDYVETDGPVNTQLDEGFGLVVPHVSGTLRGKKVKAVLYSHAERIVKYDE